MWSFDKNATWQKEKEVKNGQRAIWAMEIHDFKGTLFKDLHGQRWATFFGNDPAAPWRERPG